MPIYLKGYWILSSLLPGIWDLGTPYTSLKLQYYVQSCEGRLKIRGKSLSYSWRLLPLPGLDPGCLDRGFKLAEGVCVCVGGGGVGSICAV